MLHAILHNKAGHWFGATESANQDSESGDDFWQNKIRSLEDSRTSAIFGLLSYLSGQTLNRVLDNALKREESQLDLKWLEPEGFEFVFWPRPDNQTEPDVVVLVRKDRTVTNALIVEAKADDDHTKQDKFQRVREVNCVSKIYKPQVMQFLAVGGANREESIKGVAGTDGVEAGAIGWDALAQAVREQLTVVPRGPEKRVLRDLDAVLEWFGLRPFLGFLKPAELTDRLGPRTATKPPSNSRERAEPSAARMFEGFLEGDDLEQRIDHAAERIRGKR